MTKGASGSARPPRVARTSARRPRPALPVDHSFKAPSELRPRRPQTCAPSLALAECASSESTSGPLLLSSDQGIDTSLPGAIVGLRPICGQDLKEPGRETRALAGALPEPIASLRSTQRATPGHRPAPDHVLRRSELDTPVQRAGLPPEISVDFRAPMGTGASAREATARIRPMRESRGQVAVNSPVSGL